MDGWVGWGGVRWSGACVWVGVGVGRGRGREGVRGGGVATAASHATHLVFPFFFVFSTSDRFA